MHCKSSPSANAQSPLLRARNAWFLTRVATAGGAFSLVLAWAYSALGSAPDAVACVLACIICFGTLGLWQWKPGNALVSHLGVGLLTALFSVSVVHGSIAYIAWMGLVAILAFMLLGRAAGIAWTIVIFVVLGLTLLVIDTPGGTERLSPGSVPVRMLRVSVLVPTLAMVAYFFEQQRRQDVREVELAMAARSRLLAHVSHEMRTPLNGIIGTTQALRFEPLSGPVAEGIATIQNSGETLLSLINDLLDVARAEAGKAEYAQHPLDLGRIVELTAALHQPRAVSAGCTLNLELPSEPVQVLGDAVRLQQVLGNLVANAIRHGGGGRVDIGIAATPRGVEADVALWVKDHGMGFDEAQKERLFEPFVQLNPQTSTGGSGLGLFISRTIARDLGGDLTAISSPGNGTTFTLHLTLPVAENAGGAPEEPLFPEVLDGRVLVVDDNPINLKVASGLLRKLGLDVETAIDGECALARLRSPGIDVVLMDLQMPGLDGLQTTRALRKAGFSRPILALTASAQSETEAECLQAGMNGCLLKPMRLQHIVPLLRKALHANGARRAS